jgi:hypothetical protein
MRFVARRGLMFLLTGSIALTLAASCSAAHPTSPAPPAQQAGIVRSPLPSTATATRACPPGATQLPSAPWICAYPTFTPSPTVPTPTPWPTLPREIAQEQVRSLLQHNGGCRLPCLWGIAPGTTSGKEAYALLAPISAQVYGDADEADGNFAVDISGLPSSLDALIEIGVYLADGDVARIRAYGLQGDLAFDIPRLMREYGVPSEVWISTWATFFTARPPVIIFLLYSDLGILAAYGRNGYYDGELVRACLGDTAALRLWEPGYHLQFQQAKDLFSLSYDGIDLPSEEALGLDPQAFFETYSAVDTPCFSMPRAIWQTIGGAPYVPGG